MVIIMSEMLTEKKALKMLGADNFRNLTKDQIIEFISNIPNMDKEIAMKCLDNVPFYAECASKVTDAYYKLCESVFNAELSETDRVELEAYKMIIDACHDRIYNSYGESIPMPHDEYMDIMNTMQQAANDITATNNRITTFKKHVLDGAIMLASIPLFTLATSLGIKIKLPGR